MPRALLALAALCAAAAVVLQLFPHLTASSASTARPPHSTAAPRPMPVSDAHSAPVRLYAPAIHLSADVLPLALDGAGAIEVPGFADAAKAGWYALGPRPGQPGPAVFVGHRDAPDNVYRHGRRVGGRHLKNGAFAKIGRLHPGDRVEVERGDGSRVAFRVTRIGTYRTDRFPTARVYAPSRRPELRLITCGGLIAPDGHWDANVVVTAVAAG
ncbi:sortase domain-containing protein [Streptomyces montanisoli]|uniref:Class F sortase n=1 Tax=Streptomyces montanisoli TaxID=2798581 RepID=A0A940RY86_9ACTN|nr:sortase [Streptomyces montanisoli]MBP0461335.1 class F sortase [Streptomyces montanisoli]